MADSSIDPSAPAMTELLVNIDVPSLECGLAFYTAALGLRVGRRFEGGFAELLGADALVFLLEKPSGSSIGPAGGDVRRYDRHWSPIHIDIVVQDLGAAIDRAVRAGAVQEGGISEAPYGRIAMFADPFGHGFCLIEFNEAGYGAIVT